MENRLDQRYSVTLNGSCSAGGALSCSATIANLSPGGCEVTAHSALLEPGLEVSIMLGKWEALRGIVRWQKGSHTGIQFERDLDPKILEFILDQLEAKTAEPPGARTVKPAKAAPLSERFVGPPRQGRSARKVF